MAPKSRAKARLAFVLLTIAAASLVFVLVTCLPRDGEVVKKAARSTLRGEGGETAPPTKESGQSSSMPEAPVLSGPSATNPTTIPTRNPTESAPSAPSGSPAAVRPEKPEKGGGMAVIIDDAGYSLEDLEPFLRFAEPLTIAVLPNLPHSTEAARRVRAAGKGLLLHCPMEPLNGEDPGPGALRTDQSDDEIERLLVAAAESVPGAEGLNNHMGSKATADERLMTRVLDFAKRRGMFFVDSRTTPDTVAARLAETLSVPFLQRDVFIDNERDEPDIERSLAEGAAAARARGSAILIGHVHTPQILAILQRMLPVFQESGVRLVGLSDIPRDR